MRQTWANVWRERSFRAAMFAAGAMAVPLVFCLPLFFHHIGAKPGSMPPDLLLEAIGPYDVTWLTFTVLYGGIALGLFSARRDPHAVLRGLHAYAILQVLRMISMEVWTFEPPPDIIPLIDPVTAAFYPEGQPFLKDLFFSGHTATLAVIVGLVRSGAMRWILIAATISVGALVIVQHVHWTIDVLAAPVFARVAWKASSLSLRLFGVAAA